MKSLIIPEQPDIDLGHYGPACENFIDTIKNLFIKKKDSKEERLKKLKGSSDPYMSIADKELERDLKLTYENSQWVETHLASNSGLVHVTALGVACVDGKQLTTPEEILKVAKEMFRVLNDIYNREKPFIQMRQKLIKQIQDETDPVKVEAVWTKYSKELLVTAADRYRQKVKKPTAAFGLNPESKWMTTWPVDFNNPKNSSFGTYFPKRGDGRFVAPTPQNAKSFLNTIRELMDMAVQADWIGQQANIPYWDCLEVEYDDLENGDDIFSYLCSSQGEHEVTDLAYGIEGVFGMVICGLYIAMFDKHMVTKPANEGWVDRVKTMFGGRRATEPVKFEASKVHSKMQDFIANPDNYTFTGKKFTETDKLYLSIEGRPPALSHMPRVLEYTLREAAKLSVKFYKDAETHRRLCVPLIERFEKTMIDNMDKQGNVDQEILNKAMEPLIAAVPKAKTSYYYEFVKKDYQDCSSWLGGKPFNYAMKSFRGREYFEDIKRDAPSAIPAATDINSFTKLVQILLDSLEEFYPVWKDGRLLEDDENWVSYEFDRPVRHLWDMMSEVQQNAISTIYSFESNTESLGSTLAHELERLLNSLLHYINDSIVKK
jgi:hypothetical protein